jgi:hypothetical protein
MCVCDLFRMLLQLVTTMWRFACRIQATGRSQRKLKCHGIKCVAIQKHMRFDVSSNYVSQWCEAPTKCVYVLFSRVAPHSPRMHTCAFTLVPQACHRSTDFTHHSRQLCVSMVRSPDEMCLSCSHVLLQNAYMCLHIGSTNLPPLYGFHTPFTPQASYGLQTKLTRKAQTN